MVEIHYRRFVNKIFIPLFKYIQGHYLSGSQGNNEV